MPQSATEEWSEPSVAGVFASLARTGRDAFHCVRDLHAGRQMRTQWNASLPTAREYAVQWLSGFIVSGSRSGTSFSGPCTSSVSFTG